MPQSASFTPDVLPAVPGTYVLLIHLYQPTIIQVGKLGSVPLASGNYAYVGSAHGSGGLRARVTRHLSKDKRPHWHIDALTAVASVNEVWWSESTKRQECTWSQAISVFSGTNGPVSDFGASDCKCVTHLFDLPDQGLGKLKAALDSLRVITFR